LHHPGLVVGGSSCDTIVLRGPVRASGSPRLVRGESIARRWRVLGHIGTGGNGEVYQVLDRLLGEEVALKIVRADRSDHERSLSRFLREARLARRVVHHNVARVYEVGIERVPDQGSRHAPYMIMELVSAETLRETVLLEGTLPIARALHLGRQIAAGLAAIHRAGVVHRDMKSQNLIVDRSGGPERVVIIDFGLAREIADDDESSFTRPGEFLGTPAYTSPEQALGLPASTESDVYSLGTVLYELFTGALPYSAHSTAEVMASKRMSRPYTPLRWARPAVPGWIDEIIGRCLASEPGARYRDAGEVARALGGVSLQ
jgi:serine/threonine protein kinase